MENISNILSSTASTNREVSEVSRGAFHFLVGAPPFQHYQLAASSSTSSVHENQLQTMFHGNAITGGVFNINMALSQSRWVALNLSLQRKSFAEWCALSQTVEAAKKIDHDLVNREFSNKVVKKWLWETLRLTFASNIFQFILYSAL